MIINNECNRVINFVKSSLEGDFATGLNFVLTPAVNNIKVQKSEIHNETQQEGKIELPGDK